MSKPTTINTPGTTTDGTVVVDDVYGIYSTFGLPLDVLLTVLQTKNLMPCWISLYHDAYEAGMKHTRIVEWLRPALADVYGAKFRDNVIGVLDKLHDLKIHGFHQGTLVKAIALAKNGDDSLRSAVVAVISNENHTTNN
jgi:hypothetical protein